METGSTLERGRDGSRPVLLRQADGGADQDAAVLRGAMETRMKRSMAEVWCCLGSWEKSRTPNRRSFDYVWPQNRPNFAQDDSTYYARTSCYAANLMDRTLDLLSLASRQKPCPLKAAAPGFFRNCPGDHLCTIS